MFYVISIITMLNTHTHNTHLVTVNPQYPQSQCTFNTHPVTVYPQYPPSHSIHSIPTHPVTVHPQHPPCHSIPSVLTQSRYTLNTHCSTDSTTKACCTFCHQIHFPLPSFICEENKLYNGILVKGKQIVWGQGR